MDVNIRTVGALFQNNVRYLVPIYQRPYVWNRNDQWEPLWNDVSKVAENYLDAREAGAREVDALKKTAPHFLGALVVQQQATVAAEIGTWHIIDGQQRLTTLQLLLDAVQEIFESLDSVNRNASEFLSLLVINGEFFRKKNPDHAFKIWPASEDREPFRKVMDNDASPEGHENSAIVKAHQFFKSAAEKWLSEGSEPINSRAKALEQTLADLLQMVVIDLKTEEDAQVIFETLNARGTPLLPSDLVKNFILQKAGLGSDANAIHDKYLKDFESDWWRREVGSGQNARPRIDTFLYFWLIMRRREEREEREEVSASKIFPAFRNHVEKCGKHISEVTEDIHRFSRLYRKLEELEENDSPLGTFIYRWRVMQAGVVTPPLMWLMSHLQSGDLPRERFIRSLKGIESLLVRRMVCDMSTREYDRLFRELLWRLEDEGPSAADDTIVCFFKEQSSEARVWPDSSELMKAFDEQPLYWRISRARLRMVLEAIGNEVRAPMTEEPNVPRGLTIEHVMPQEWQKQWPITGELGKEMDENAILNAARERSRIIHTIGNLTLLTQRLNSALSNAPWTEKRGPLGKHSVLALTRNTLLDEDRWDEQAIRRRGAKLYKAAAKVWPHADEI